MTFLLKRELMRKRMTFKNDKFIFSHLAWDTEYFGHKSGKLVLKEKINETDLDEIKKLTESYRFITITNKNNNAFNNILIGEKTNAFLTDMNVQFSKDLTLIANVNPEDRQMIIIEAMEYNERILNIAEGAFVYSRFFNDINLPLEKSKIIYENWLKNAFDKEGKFFVTFKNREKIEGFILFVVNGETAVIELIAVDPLMNSKGIGRKMINHLSEYLALDNISSLNVGTQVDNLKAQNFYNNCGFKLVSGHSIYHWWSTHKI